MVFSHLALNHTLSIPPHPHLLPPGEKGSRSVICRDGYHRSWRGQNLIDDVMGSLFKIGIGKILQTVRHDAFRPFQGLEDPTLDVLGIAWVNQYSQRTLPHRFPAAI